MVFEIRWHILIYRGKFNANDSDDETDDDVFWQIRFIIYGEARSGEKYDYINASFHATILLSTTSFSYFIERIRKRKLIAAVVLEFSSLFGFVAFVDLCSFVKIVLMIWFLMRAKNNKINQALNFYEQFFCRS